ncbi:MHS family MFS transporter [Acinetobacter sp. AOR15_HL]|uniref:MFS transporter n=1 Tax=unclassified Acinetobacter TaxID=196816 RepID=UPI0022EADD0A|nr:MULTISPECIES: MFS transporter [unclassified Acinetobacter]MDA3557173.1 MHS family MFS transporter [Acinetobacter sp. AOR15_HL]MDA3572782.1 MHS family MFS transporter [Acinetobacter sp. AOR14_HL]
MESTSATAAPAVATNSKTRVLFASLVGTTIEFFDFYIYATAAVLIFPHLFFPASSGSAAVLQSLATFAIAFIARPIGAALFGHLGDRIGRKATLVAALLTMGISTVCIGLLPTYAQIGLAAPLLLAVCRLGQGLGLGGEWSGAVLLATENAPEGKRAWYGMFPQLGAPIGFILATGSFLLLGAAIPEQAFMQWGWRIPFIASAVLVIVGLYIRLKLHETPAFQKVLDKQKEVNIPFKEVLTKHTGKLVLGTIAAICTFVVFYLTTVFALNWGTTKLGYSRGEFLELQLFATLCFAAFIPLSAIFAEKFGRKATSIGVCIAAAIFGLFFSSMLESGNTLIVFLFLCTGLSIMGLTYGPIGTVLSELFPTSVRYTGSALTFNLAGIFGASFAPLIATKLAETYGLYAVGYYLTAASLLSLIAFLFIRETKNDDVNNQI